VEIHLPSGVDDLRYKVLDDGTTLEIVAFIPDWLTKDFKWDKVADAYEDKDRWDESAVIRGHADSVASHYNSMRSSEEEKIPSVMTVTLPKKCETGTITNPILLVDNNGTGSMSVMVMCQVVSTSGFIEKQETMVFNV